MATLVSVRHWESSLYLCGTVEAAAHKNQLAVYSLSISCTSDPPPVEAGFWPMGGNLSCDQGPEMHWAGLFEST